MSEEETEYECAITGEMAAAASPQGDLGSLPDKWTKITIQRREVNPQWLAIMQVKQSALQGLLMQFGSQEEAREGAWAVGIQVDAQFCALEERTPMYITYEDVVYVSPEDDAIEGLNEIRDILDLPEMPDNSDDDEEEEGDSDDEEEEEEDED